MPLVDLTREEIQSLAEPSSFAMNEGQLYELCKARALSKLRASLADSEDQGSSVEPESLRPRRALEMLRNGPDTLTQDGLRIVNEALYSVEPSYLPASSEPVYSRGEVVEKLSVPMHVLATNIGRARVRHPNDLDLDEAALALKELRAAFPTQQEGPR